MVHPFLKSSRLVIFSPILTSLTLSACVTTSSEFRGALPDERLFSSEPTLAGTFLHPVSALFIGMDTNKDKMTSRDELVTGIKSEWSNFDSHPSAVNFTPWVIDTMGSMDSRPNFLSFDKDFNGVITENEFTNQLEREFNRLDKDKDGQITRAEMSVSIEAPQGRRARGGNREERPQGGERGGGRPQR